MAREIRITLGQLPGGLAAGPGLIRIIGQGEMTRNFVRDISPRLAAMGLTVQASERLFRQSQQALPADLAASPAAVLAAAWIAGRDTTLEFLPPKVRPWQQYAPQGNVHPQAHLGRRGGGGPRRLCHHRFRRPANHPLPPPFQLGRAGA